MFDNIKHFLSNRINAALVGALVLILIGASFGVYKVLSKPAAALPEEVIELGFDPEGPYAILEPRKDGYAVNLNMFRVASYKAFSYQLVYSSLGTTAGEEYSEGPIDRGHWTLILSLITKVNFLRNCFLELAQKEILLLQNIVSLIKMLRTGL